MDSKTIGICPQRFESPRAWRASRPPKLPGDLPAKVRIPSSLASISAPKASPASRHPEKSGALEGALCRDREHWRECLAETGARLLFSSPVGLRGTCGLVKLLEKRKTRSSLRLAQVRKSALLGGAALLVSFWSVLSGPAAKGRLAALQRRGPFLFKNCGKQVIPIGTAPWEARTPDLEVSSLTL